VMWALSVCTPILTALVALGVRAINRWSVEHVQNEQLRGIMNRATTAAHLAVAGVQQTVVDDLKRLSADGRLTGDDAREALADAKAWARRLLGPDGIAQMNAIVGDADDWLVAMIEQAVREQKRGGS